ncbi:hypothetical protein BJP36_38825 [Moorena producens JHB]|uniref:Uncharacterized protein n=1 Tax=Moorena producens (strain JHB) TaxID=1454205 RepID=A0A9Q9UWL6_MOOP1|nr:hypothetical protein [Moorena producens]WAN70025.1 hypothetical protein BJP36_38825 [Moorena producens JHB]
MPKIPLFPAPCSLFPVSCSLFPISTVNFTFVRLLIPSRYCA